MNGSQPDRNQLLAQIHDQIEQVVQGQSGAIEHLTIALAAGGHVLLEGVPGVAKTLLARSLASALQASFGRVQFTPDLMPSDVIGVNVFEPRTAEFRFRPGPIFGEIILVDEINRAPAKTQAALLEAMQEGQVTIDGVTHPLPEIFMVVATQNPIEYEGTYPLPEAQLDRFLLKVIVDYPAQESEEEMLTQSHRLGADAHSPAQRIQAVATPEQVVALRQAVHQIEVDQAVVQYVAAIIRKSRELPSLTLGASPRSGVMLLAASKALAYLRGQPFLTPEEVREMAVPVLRHRIRPTPEAQIEGLTADDCLQTLLREIEVPR